MKVKAAVFLMMVMSILSTLKADYPVIPICVNVSGDQTLPDIDGPYVIWYDGLDICFSDLSDLAAGWTPLSLPGTQDHGSVGGGRIVWRDRRDSDDDIGGYDIASGTFFELNFGDGPDQRYPQVSQAYIVCEDRSGAAFNAAVFNDALDAFEVIAPTAAMQTNLDLDGSVLVWRDDRDGHKQVFWCDLDVKPYAAAAVYPGDHLQWNPAVSGNIVVWEDHPAEGDVDLVAYDLAQKAVVWTNTDPGNQLNPSVCDGLVVWQEGEIGDYDIRGYDLNYGTPLNIATEGQNDEYPAVSGRTVVWQRNGTDIVGAVIPIPTVLAVTEPAGGEQVLAQTSLQIDWEMVQGTPPQEVKLQFSADDGQSWQIIEPNVPADDGWLWTPVADVSSQECRIKVSDVADAAVSAVSEPFTVFQCDPGLTADVTGDCFVGLDDLAALAAQWLTCGNPYDPLWCSSQ